MGNMINRLNADLVYFSKVFNGDTIKKINVSEFKISELQKEIEAFKILVDNATSQTQFQALEKSLQKFATHEQLKDMREDLKSKAESCDVLELIVGAAENKKAINKMPSREEIVTRLNVMTENS